MLVSLLSFAGAPALAQEAASAADESALGFERTPPRLSFTDGEVSYWRPGAEEWTEAQVNTPLAAGDELSTGPGANLELQVGGRAYVRAGEQAQLGLTALEPDYLRLRLANGTAALDLRELPSGQTLEIDTPNAAFTIERPGYYRVEVESGSTKFISRRGGRATVTTATGLPEPIGASEQVVITGTDTPVLATYAAPEIDEWDRWNYGRTDEKVAAASSRYVPAGVYGVDDLDRNGDWQTTPAYGAVWVPRVAVGWAPYSAGAWVADPYYGWTWVDDAPWGWAPFHYGRWVYVNSYWAWSPGPRIVRPYYSPALVAFYSSPSVSVSVSFGAPFGWVALGWGEPVVPWWGPRGCHGVARWSGWGGPRVVNNVVVNNNHYVNVNNIHRYEHAGRRGAMVAVDRDRFGRGHVRNARIARFDRDRLAPVRGGDLGVRAGRRSLTPSDRHGTRPSREILERRVVTRRDPGRRDPAASDASGRARTQSREARAAEPQGDRARAGTRSDFRQGRSTPPPLRVARAETSERRGSAPGRARAGTRDAPRERAVSQPRPRVESGRREQTAPRQSVQPRAQRRERATAPRASAPPTRERATQPRAAQPRAPQRQATRAAPTRSQAAPRAAPRREAQPRSQPRSARAAPDQRRERAAPREQRMAPREQRVAPRERSSAAPSRVSPGRAQPDRQQGRERASQPRSSPAPRGSGQGQRNRDGGGGGGRDSDGPRTRRG